jgi:transposase-like protein
MSKYTKELKLAVVQDFESLKAGSRFLSKKYDVPRTILKTWIYGYQCHGADYFEKRPQFYSPEFKLNVLQHMKAHHMSPIRVAALFGIPAFTSVIQWQKLYNSGGAAALEAKPRGRPKMTKPKPKIDKPPKEMTPEELLEEVLNLRAERDYLKKLQALIQEKQLAAKTKPH